jgi:hypothetical protein
MNTLTTIIYVNGPLDGMEYNIPSGYPDPGPIITEEDNPGGCYARGDDGRYYWRLAPEPAPIRQAPILPAPKVVARKGFPVIGWIIAGIVIGVSILMALFAIAIVSQQPARIPEPLPVKVPLDEAVPTPVPKPTPADYDTVVPDPNWKPTVPDKSVSAPRAELVGTPVRMPYGEILPVRLRGSVADQESLPLSGNSVGDAYLIGRYLFVWTQAGQWIDPIVQ